MAGLSIGLGLALAAVPPLPMTTAPLEVIATPEGEIAVENAYGALTVTVTDPAEFAGTYATDTAGAALSVANLSLGPQCLVAPKITGSLAASTGETLALAPGLWIYDDAFGEAAISTAWEHDTLGDAAYLAATGPTLPAAASGNGFRARETASQNGGRERSAGSVPVLASDTGYEETFEQANNTAISSIGTFSGGTSQGKVIGGAYTLGGAPSATADYWTYTAVSIGDNQFAQFTVGNVGSYSNSTPILFLRYQSGSQFYALDIGDGSAPAYKFGGTAILSLPALTAGERVRVVAKGNAHRVFFEDQLVGSVDHSSALTGPPGVGIYANSGAPSFPQIGDFACGDV